MYLKENHYHALGEVKCIMQYQYKDKDFRIKKYKE